MCWGKASPAYAAMHDVQGQQGVNGQPQPKYIIDTYENPQQSPSLRKKGRGMEEAGPAAESLSDGPHGQTIHADTRCSAERSVSRPLFHSTETHPCHTHFQFPLPFSSSMVSGAQVQDGGAETACAKHLRPPFLLSLPTIFWELSLLFSLYYSERIQILYRQLVL